MRLGVELCADEQLIERVINEDGSALDEILKGKSFTITGDSYIPDCAIDDYNREYGTNHPLREVDYLVVKIIV